MDPVKKLKKKGNRQAGAADSRRADHRFGGKETETWSLERRMVSKLQTFFNFVTIVFTASFILFQFTSWVDAVIFVFSLENETSFNAIYNYYAKMSQYRNMQDIPLILVGTQGEIMRYMTLFQQVLTPLVTTYLALHRGAV